MILPLSSSLPPFPTQENVLLTWSKRSEYRARSLNRQHFTEFVGPLIRSTGGSRASAFSLSNLVSPDSGNEDPLPTSEGVG